jgi:hypothetical protein
MNRLAQRRCSLTGIGFAPSSFEAGVFLELSFKTADVRNVVVQLKFGTAFRVGFFGATLRLQDFCRLF